MSTQPLSPQPTRFDPAIQRRFEELLEKVRSYRSDDAAADLLRRAFEFAAERHAGQTRRSGEPYLVHPLEVAEILADMRLDPTSLAAGLLHDVIEDTKTPVEDIQTAFGADVARVVDGVTKLGRIHYRSDEERQAETFRKMLLAMTQDIRVILVKLADRLHNMRTLRHLDRARQVKIASETREVYAPLALRLGMGKVRAELEDLAFAYLEPEAYRKVASYLESKRESSDAALEATRRKILLSLKKSDIPAEVQGRVKRAYSIYRKLQRQHIDIEQVYDLLALRLITDSKRNCYAALGVIHDKWRPIPDRIKDFIAMPRPNGYQSLHTSVITQEGLRFEVQIRTREMHREAEEGICAHWKYKEGRVDPEDDDDQRIAWIRRLVEWQRDMPDADDFLAAFKVDLYPEEVYVFTPKGRLIVLPREATPLDFAYAIHTEVGHACVGAKVDGRIVPLRYKLQNGEQVEILTQKGRQPSADWLKLVTTSRARHKIRQSLNARRRRQAEEIGGKLLERELRRVKLPVSEAQSEALAAVAAESGCSQIADFHAALGYGRLSPRSTVERLLRKLRPEQPFAEPAPPSTDREPQAPPALKVKGVDDLLVYRARCCNPIGGEPIVGYVTRGKGVAVHSRSCPNVQNLMYEAERRIDVEWGGARDETFRVRLSIHVDDRPNILHDVTEILSKENVNISQVESRSGRGQEGPVVLNLTMDLHDVEQLERISSRIGSLPYVREVSRGRL